MPRVWPRLSIGLLPWIIGPKFGRISCFLVVVTVDISRSDIAHSIDLTFPWFYSFTEVNFVVGLPPRE
jgi:hypothetical protein